MGYVGLVHRVEVYPVNLVGDEVDHLIYGIGDAGFLKSLGLILEAVEYLSQL